MANTRVTPRFWNVIDEIDRELQDAILRLLGSRGLGQTVTLRDAALAVGGESWGSLMERTLAIAQGLAAAGMIEILDGGALLGPTATETASNVRLKVRGALRRVAPSRLN